MKTLLSLALLICPLLSLGRSVPCNDAQCRIDALVGEYLSKEIFSGTLLVRHRGRDRHWHGGNADDSTQTANGPNTVYLIASISKGFVAAQILKLAEQGRVRLHDAVYDWIPEYPRENLVGTNGQPVTIEHLLTHASGVPEAYEDSRILGRIDKARLSFFDFLTVNLDRTLRFSPGDRFQYSNTGYVLLGEVARRAEDTSAPGFLGPLGLNSTTVGAPAETRRLARCYRKRNFRRVDYARDVGATLPLADSEVYADMNIYSTASDLAKWVDDVTSGVVLTPASTRAMLTPHQNSYGYGWYVFHDEKGRQVYEHSGTYGAFQSWARRYPGEETTIILLSNQLMDNDEISRFFARIATAALSASADRN